MPEPLRVRSLFREYEVEFSTGALERIAAMHKSEELFIVVDERILELHANALAPVAAAPRSTLHALEQEKTIEATERLLERMVNAGVRRNHRIVVVGGGITQDIAAFAASVLYRGLEWIFVPTTLLAQCDSCIGSKTSINLGDKKNLVGNFWPPTRVIIDTDFLYTLPVDDIFSGIGEMLHFYLYADSKRARPLIEERAAITRDRSQLVPFIEESLRIKRSVVELDEFDQHERHKFNYGHTFGHALESVTGYAIPHGLAVTVGMDIANFVSREQGLMPAAVFEELHLLLSRNFPARRWSADMLEPFIGYLRKDKKNLGGNIGCILARRAGELVPQQIPADESFRFTLASYFDGPWWR